MIGPARSSSREYVDTDYQQFRPGGAIRWLMAAIGVLAWPFVIPLALLSRLSDVIFRSCSEFLSLIPYFPGVIFRYEFYRFALTRCGRNVVIEFGAVFIYRDVHVGDNVLLGRFSIVHHCDIGSHVLIGERVTLLSGSRQHRFDRSDIPMALQGGQKRRIVIGDDVWLGSHSVIMDDVADGCVVAAGSVLSAAAPSYSIMGGVPARKLRDRSS